MYRSRATFLNRATFGADEGYVAEIFKQYASQITQHLKPRKRCYREGS